MSMSYEIVQANATEHLWWQISAGSDNGFVNKPLLKPVLIQIYVPYGVTRPQWAECPMTMMNTFQ